jgi:Uncharacterized conserved protein
MAKKQTATSKAKEFAAPSSAPGLPTGYIELLGDLKRRVRTAQIKAARSVNRELIQLYWEIGGLIVHRQQGEMWANAVIERLAADLQAEFPEMKGLSQGNLYRMRSLYLIYAQGFTAFAQAARNIEGTVFAQAARNSTQQQAPQPVAELQTPPKGRIVAQAVRQLQAPLPSDDAIQQAVGQFPIAPLPPEIAELPWGHNIALLEKLDSNEDRLWYARQTALHGWSRSVLVAQIETEAHKRQGQALTNFDRTLPPPQSDLARQLLKDPYTFEFLGLADDIHERELERSLLDHLKQFLVELGTGFAFVGSQYHLEIGGDDFYIDLLFYHLKLRCFVVIDLKTESFQPEFAGKMNFYLAAVDDLVKHASDSSSIGLILCKERNHVVVEYALRDSSRPLGVATYQLLPPAMRANLPSPEQLQAELDKYT